MNKPSHWDIIFKIWELSGELIGPDELKQALQKAQSDPLTRYCAELALDLSHQGLPDEFILPVLRSYAALLNFHKIIIQSERNELEDVAPE